MSLKVELVDDKDDATRAGTFEYIEALYDRVRRHSSLGSRSPAEYERPGQPLTPRSSFAGKSGRNLKLIDKQIEQVDDLRNDVDAELAGILTADQEEQIRREDGSSDGRARRWSIRWPRQPDSSQRPGLLIVPIRGDAPGGAKG